MDIQNIIKFLENEGYVVTKKNKLDNYYEGLYYMQGEFWENNPRAYVADIEGAREDFSQALTRLNYDELVRDWEDSTLRDVVWYGSDLAFNKEQRRALMKAASKEIKARREEFRTPTRNGMAEDGGPRYD